MGYRAHGQWVQGVWATWAIGYTCAPRGIGYRDMGIWGNRVQGYGVQDMDHMGNGVQGVWVILGHVYPLAPSQ